MSDLRTTIDPDFPAGALDLARLIEAATHCRINDEKRPGLVGLPTLRATQVCPEDLSMPSATEGAAEGSPPNWFVRVVFDELLDPNVEDLIDQLDAMMQPTGVKLGTFAMTQPVTLKCNGVDVPYNGYYVPNGSRVSWPLGPALFVQPNSALSVQTGAACEIGIKDKVVNKDGEAVPTDQRTFPFKIAPMKLRFSIPDPTDDGATDGSFEQDLDSVVAFYWTAPIDPLKLPAAADISIFAGTDASTCNTGGTRVPDAEVAVKRRGATAATTALVMDLNVTSDPMHKWKPSTTYRIEFGPNAKVGPSQLGADGTFPAGYKLCFQTTAAM